RGKMVEDCVSSFPSVTPVASSEMMTGTGPAGHWVMGMNWYHRIERRYIEYGSSFEATRTFGLFRAMYDLVYNMNLDHLSWQAQTIFERLGDAGIRTAATPFLIYRGRHRHQLGLDAFLDEHAVVLTSDHAQTDVEHALPLADELAEDWAVLQPNTDRPEEAEIAVSPTSRAGAVYILDTGRRHGGTHERARLRLR